MRTILDTIIFSAGFAICWVCKEPVLRLVIGADPLIRSLKMRLAMLRGKP